MLTLDLNVILKKPLIFLKKSLSLRAKFSLTSENDSIPILNFLEELFKNSNFLPFSCFPLETSDNSLTNFRGRPIEGFYQSASYPQYSLEKPQQEEIFYLSGEIVEETEDEDEKGVFINKTPYNYRINSLFKSFKNNSDIVYNLSYTMEPIVEEVDHLISRKKFSQLKDYPLNCLRIGFDSFRQSSFGGMLGLVPVVKEKFYLEVTPSFISIFAENNYLTSEITLPFAKHQVLEKVDQALAAINLYHGFKAQILAKI